jgi:hypothetical protein
METNIVPFTYILSSMRYNIELEIKEYDTHIPFIASYLDDDNRTRDNLDIYQDIEDIMNTTTDNIDNIDNIDSHDNIILNSRDAL